AVDNNVDPFVIAHDALKQRLHFALAGVIDRQRDRAAAGGLDHGGGLVDGLGASVLRRLPFDTSSRAVDRRAGLTERTCDAAAGAPRGSRHKGDASGEWLLRGFRL